jgi:hypothetical protein
VTRAQNGVDPGTRDLEFPEPPLYQESGGPDGRPCIQFNGSSEYGEAGGFSCSEGTTGEPGLQVVGNFTNTRDTMGVGVALYNPSYQTWYDSFVHAMHAATGASEDTYRANSHPVGVPHNIDWGRPEADNDTAHHLFETFMWAAGMQAFFDGQSMGTGGDQGIKQTVTHVSLGRSADRYGYAPVCISEVVVTEGRTPAQAAAYRTERIRVEYPSLLD